MLYPAHKIKLMSDYSYSDEKITSYATHEISYDAYDCGKLYTVDMRGYVWLHYFKFYLDEQCTHAIEDINNIGSDDELLGFNVYVHNKTSPSDNLRYSLKDIRYRACWYRAERIEYGAKGGDVVLMGLGDEYMDTIRLKHDNCSGVYKHHRWYRFLIDNSVVGYMSGGACKGTLKEIK